MSKFTFHEIADMALSNQKQGEAERERMAQVATRKAVQNAFQLLCSGYPEPEYSLTGLYEIATSGLLLRYELPHDPGFEGYWKLRGTCNACMTQQWSVPCYSLADIGKQLECFEPETHGVCTFAHHVREALQGFSH